LIQRVLAMPNKRFDRRPIDFLVRPEIDALLAAPDRSTWAGRRDHALLLVAVETGLRCSELAGLRIESLVLERGPHVRCHGKGRKERCTPYAKRLSLYCAPGFAKAQASRLIPFFQTLEVAGSALTVSNTLSQSTSLSPADGVPL
jgi:site-specific recombinase XerD